MDQRSWLYFSFAFPVSFFSMQSDSSFTLPDTNCPQFHNSFTKHGDNGSVSSRNRQPQISKSWFCACF